MNKLKRTIAKVMTLVLLIGMLPTISAHNVSAADEATVKVTSLGSKGTVEYGSKTKSGNWYQMSVGNNKAFCMDLGKACHNGNTYEKTTSYSWNQSTSGEKNGRYAKILRWFVIDKKKSSSGFTLAQALIWSVSEDRISKTQLTDVIRTVKNNTGYFSAKTAEQLYDDIFDPDGAWTVSASIWTKKGENADYQRLMIVEANALHECSYLSGSIRYRQRITVKKYNEWGQPLRGATFRLTAKNLDDLYSFSMSDLTGGESSSDEDNNVKFASVGITRDDGVIAWLFTYYVPTREYAYYPEAKLDNMTAAEKKAAKKYLTDELDLVEGVDFGSNMTKAQAENLRDKEKEKLKAEILNKYQLVELGSGNANIALDATYAAGKTITIDSTKSWYKNSDGVWPDSLLDKPADYEKAVREEIVNRYKKIKLKVVKKDGYSSDGKAHGDATLDGAVYGVYTDSACTSKAQFFSKEGATLGNEFTIENGSFVSTGYLRCGQTVYIKELKAPEGYKLSQEVKSVYISATKIPDNVLFSDDPIEVQVTEQPELGHFEIWKNYKDNKGEHPEKGASFQIYLLSKGSYNACSEYERDTLVMDENGYAKSKDLYIGEYVLHQTGTGGMDSIMIDDETFYITKDGDSREIERIDEMWGAKLKIIKKDGNTGKNVLNPNTAFQIYQIDSDNKENLIVQRYLGEDHDTFYTNENGEVETYEPLLSGKYKIYERETAPGLHIVTPSISFEVNSMLSNYTSTVDKDGKPYQLITMEYVNEETAGQLKIFKTGEQLSEFKDGKFVYEKKLLKGAEFDIFADGDVVTQDNQGTTWYKDGDLVATVKTGEGAVFAKECKNITNYSLDPDGTVIVNLPLGKYKVKERKTAHGFLKTSKEWTAEFTWENKDDVFVIDAANEDGVIKVENARAKANVTLEKTDAFNKAPIKNVVFGVYSKDDIYNSDNTKIVSEDEKLGTITTDEDGKAKLDFDFPLKSEEYGSKPFTNSGSYYLVEESVSDSYYTDSTRIPFTVEYEGDNVEVVARENNITNTPTEVSISKIAIGGSEELPGCKLEVAEKDSGKEIVSWESGSKAAELSKKADELGYANLRYEFNKDGSLKITGLKHDTDYVLTEKRPADGFTTADDITFKIVYDETTDSSKVMIASDDGTYTDAKSVVMEDDTTKIEFSKTDIAGSKEIPGCELEVTEKDSGSVIDTWTSTTEKHIIEGKLIVGKTYVLTEKRPADGYATADKIEFIIEDTGKIQSVQMKDDTTKIEFSKTDVTGSEEIPGCELEVVEKETGTVIDKWTSTSEKHLIEGKLIVGKTYVLSEKRPADGFVTADKVEFVVTDTGLIQKIHMVDKKTTILFNKESDSKEPLAGATIEVIDEDGNVIKTFTTSKNGNVLEGILVAGKTYIFKEIKAPKGYQIAKPIKYTVLDNPDIQVVKMTDKKFGTIITNTPNGFGEGVRTGDDSPINSLLIILGLSAVCALVAGYILVRKKGGRENENN